jgi:16S rRNA (guanine(1405)-N(7))-methyltransferase
LTDADHLLALLRTKKKYRHLCPETLERITHWALSRTSSTSQASLLARRKLHQIYGAYWGPGSLGRLSTLVDGIVEGAAEIEETCWKALELHASTRERLPHLERCYSDLWAITGPPTSVLDLAAGLSPFALPWMALPQGCEYYPSDIDSGITGQVNRLLRHLGRRETAVCRDLLVAGGERLAGIDDEPDVCLLFKTLSCLERQDPAAGRRLLNEIRSRVIVLSMPTRSLGGAGRGMAENYRSLLRNLTKGLRTAEIDYPGEIFTVVFLK